MTKEGLINSAAADEYNQAIATAEKESDPAQRAADIAKAKQAYSAALVGPAPTTLPAYPTAATQPTATTAATRPADILGVLSDNKFLAAQGLLASKAAPVLSDRQAIATAAGDSATKAIFKVLGDPNLAAQFTDKKVLFGVTTIAVEPGWRTKKGYCADASMIVRYRWGLARPQVVDSFVRDPSLAPALRRRVAMDSGHAPPPDATGETNFDNITVPEQLRISKEETATPIKSSPLVAAVSPMTETQTLDLANSFRRQDELSIQLAFALRMAGLGGQADAFEKYAKSLQQDVNTLNANVVVNSYSYAGGIYGFQVGPRLKALEQVRSGKAARSEEVLDRTSFPALVIFGFDSRDIRPKVLVGDEQKFVLYEPYLQLTTAHSWSPTLNGSQRRFSERERLEWSYAVNQDRCSPGNGLPPKTATFMENRLLMLKSKVFGVETNIELPSELLVPGKPTVLHVTASNNQIMIDDTGKAIPTDIELFLAGENLKQVDVKAVGVPVGHVVKDSVTASLIGDALLVKLTLADADAPLVLSLPATGGETVYTPAVEFKSAPMVARVTAIAPDHVMLTRNDRGNPIAAVVPMLIAGNGLKQVDLSRLRVIEGHAEILKDPDPPGFEGNSIRLSLSVNDDSAPIVLELPPSKPGQRSVNALPLAVKLEPAVTRDVVLERLTGPPADQSKQSVERLTYPAASSADARKLLGKGGSSSQAAPAAEADVHPK